MPKITFTHSGWILGLPLAILTGWACGNEGHSGRSVIVSGGDPSGGTSSASGGTNGTLPGAGGTGGVKANTSGGTSSGTSGGASAGTSGGNANAAGGMGGNVSLTGGSSGLGGSASAGGGSSAAGGTGGVGGSASAAGGTGGSSVGGTSGAGGSSSGGAACTGGLEFLSTVLLDADGPAGVDTYTRIYNAFGPDAIEAPDLYPTNHPGSPHIVEASDGIVGNHFVFKIHRDMDWDRDTGATDRQRNEIKTYEGSSEVLKARLGETFLITWKFKIDAAMPVSKNFSHFFQLKGVGGDDAHPLVTITGAKKSNVDVMEIRQADSAVDQILGSTSWAGARGQWLEVSCLATFTDTGSLKLTIKTLDGTVLIAVDKTNVDLWRAGDFIRPKWGIYRSLSDPTSLRPEEDTVAFANFSVSKVRACP